MYKNLIIYCVYLKVCYCEAIRDMVAEQMQTSKNMMHSCKIQQHGPPQGPHCQFFKFSFLSKFTFFNILPKNV